MGILIGIVFIAGYLLIAIEEKTGINKSAAALVTAVVCWTIFMIAGGANATDMVNTLLQEHLGNIAGILFFLLGAMAIVELVDAHDGFEVIAERIKTQRVTTLLWVVCFIAFFLSAVLDNLTTTIVMISLVKKLVGDKEQRLQFAGMIVIAANAGGAWSPIGDVTTTMLWIGGQLSSFENIKAIFLPSLASLVTPLVYLTVKNKRKNLLLTPVSTQSEEGKSKPRNRNLVFFCGIAVLVLVPVFKTFTHLPPYMGMLLGLGILWIITELLNKGRSSEDKHFYTVAYAIRKADTPSVLFFLGILLTISCLEATGMLEMAAHQLDSSIREPRLIVGLIGLLSSIVDNVPLVAASMGMYSLDQYPMDHSFWHFMAYCTGTGGSILVIGSAAGVAAMGLEKIDFIWYLKNISWLALIGYLAGILVFII